MSWLNSNYLAILIYAVAMGYTIFTFVSKQRRYKAFKPLENKYKVVSYNEDELTLIIEQNFGNLSGRFVVSSDSTDKTDFYNFRSQQHLHTPPIIYHDCVNGNYRYYILPPSSLGFYLKILVASFVLLTYLVR